LKNHFGFGNVVIMHLDLVYKNPC